MSSLAYHARRHPVFTGIGLLVLVLVIVAALFDWNWVRAPIERYISQKTQRTFKMDDLHVRLGFTPTVRMRNVYFGNAKWSKEEAMARVEMVEFSISLRDLPDKILIPRVALTKPDLVFEKLKDERRNWVLAEPSESSSPSKLRISTLSVDEGRLRYFDHGEPFNLEVIASTFDPAQQEKVKDADAAPSNNRYSTRYAFSGKYHDAGFSGTALTGEVLSFQESGVPFPFNGDLKAGTTRVRVEGTIADAADISGIDTQLRIEGETLANLYPFLLLPLPASPPYSLRGHLILKGNRYTIDDLEGKIGSTDIYGKGAYVDQEPRPLLTAELHSKLLKLTDLGPVIGVQTKESGGKPATSQAATNKRETAKAADQAADPNHILPAGKFDGSRLEKIDAEVTLDAARLEVPSALPLESLRASLRLKDAVLDLSQLDFGFAGGTIASRAKLDARQPIINTDLQVDFKKIQIAKLLPKQEKIAQGAGQVGGALKLNGRGNSIADAAAKANGSLHLAVVNGRISNLADAVSGLNGGKVVQLLLSGDKTIAVNCGGVAFDVAGGQGRSTLMVIDTEETQIVGTGSFDLAAERFDFLVEPKPKNPGILSLRTPVRATGSFKNPEFQIEKGPLLARAGGAIALALTAPLAALLPLIETGPGVSTDCGRVKREAGSMPKSSRKNR
ncbi:AsmA family protein [Variovorax sp. UMC13]|uniref:AsmA family protein n=1 Tax=Variovorax sp. UMC13 TaxID=1862326 RepID=UPI00160498F0|nr:AsmA family protein [Variovorax sp. UMC13]